MVKIWMFLFDRDFIGVYNRMDIMDFKYGCFRYGGISG